MISDCLYSISTLTLCQEESLCHKTCCRRRKICNTFSTAVLPPIIRSSSTRSRECPRSCCIVNSSCTSERACEDSVEIIPKHLTTCRYCYNYSKTSSYHPSCFKGERSRCCCCCGFSCDICIVDSCLLLVEIGKVKTSLVCW